MQERKGLRGSCGVRRKYDDVNACISKVHTGSYGAGYTNYSLSCNRAKVLRGSNGVRNDYKGMNACISKVHSGSYGVG